MMRPATPPIPTNVSNSLIRFLQQAEKHLHAGDAAAAQSACERVLRTAPRNPDALFLLGIALLSQGRVADAVPAFEKVLAADRRHGAALENLGLAHLMLGRFGEAELALQRASSLVGAPASVFMRLGIAMLEQGRAAEAVSALRRALALDPRDPDCQLNLGRCLAATGDTDGAHDCFEAALRLAPERPEPTLNLGVMALQRDDLIEAQRWFERSIAQAPMLPDARLNLAIVLQRQDRFDPAAEQLRTALTFSPSNPAVLSELARTFALQRRLEQAREQYLHALAVAPDFAPANEGMASVCIAMGRCREAIQHLRATLATEPSNVAALSALASAQLETGDLLAAQEAAQKALTLEPLYAASYATLANVHLLRDDLGQALTVLEAGYSKTQASALLGMLTYQLRQACDWDKWRNAWHELRPLLDSEASLGSPFWLLCEPTTAAQQLGYTRRWASARFGERKALTPAAPREAHRVRVGYLSADLHDHATAYLVAEVLEHHDRDRFEVFAYSYGPEDNSAMRRRLRDACEHFTDIALEPDDLAAERIRADTLDILVDLKGYTLGDRLTIMAKRPCAVQLTWLGYPGTTGSSFIDYLIADPVVVPAGAEGQYSERILRLPHCYQPNDRARKLAQPRCRQDYGLPAQGFVFCCFNQTYKITPDVFAVWMRLLTAVPGSVLWLFESNPLAKAHLSRFAGQHGVDPERLVFASRLPNSEHLARYCVADLALDTFPYTSHTTMSDALWSGCVSVALCGETFAARVSTSVLTAAGLPDLVTHSLDRYENLALKLASDPDLMHRLRERIVNARDHAPLFDSRCFTRDLEALYLDVTSMPST